MHRTIVIGRGLIGSAAARHLAETTDGVLCIGPDEPQDIANHTGVFASHYDEGRLTRIFDPAHEWSITAKRSIERYRDLQDRSGIGFFTPTGFLGLGDPATDYNRRGASAANLNGAVLEQLDAAAIRTRFPFLTVADDADGIVETGTAGHISPRRLVKAQTVLAEQAGASIIRQAASAVRPVTNAIEVELADGSTVQADKVLIATGAFTTPCGICPVDLSLTTYGRTVVLARVEGDAIDVLRNMPTMVVSANGAYILPPILYPDGHSYVKIGIGTDADPQFETLAGLQGWFKGPGSDDDRVEFTRFLTTLIPVLKDCQHWQTASCAVTKTASGLPVIDFVHDDRIAVAVGGCGKGAKGSDEWGRIAADLVRNADWTADVAREQLALSNSI